MLFYWRQTYIVQIVAALMMFLAMPLQWSSDHGTGLELMNKALDTTIGMGIDPFNPKQVPLSQWWIVWIIPALGAILGLRAVNGIIFKQLEGKQFFTRAVTIAMFMASGWYAAVFSPTLKTGFWIEMVAAWTLIVAVWLELWLIEFMPIESKRRFVAPSEPEQVAASSQASPAYHPICAACGHLNPLGTAQCQQCHQSLYGESEA